MPNISPSARPSFAESLVAYLDKDIAKATSTSLGRHLWYLSEQLVGLALFDEDLSLTTKQDMVEGMKVEGARRF